MSIRTLFALLFAALGSAQHVVDDLSFGHREQLSPHSGGTIPHWQASSSKHNLQILSDRAILTPPSPGNAKGSLWAERSVDSPTWHAEVEFRASGQETGSGNFNIFYAKDKAPILAETVYTVGRFDGLVITVDQYGNTGGKIRGFLNDGTQNFKDHGHLESLAFGHCDYAYRNLGRPSRLKIINQDGLRVEVDGRECFSTGSITLPSGYYFGVTASTAEHPDSFEINKFLVSNHIPEGAHIRKPEPPLAASPEHHQQPVQQLQKLDRLPRAPESVPDANPDEFKSTGDQFADLHNRLQALSHQIAEVFLELEQIGLKLDDQHGDIMGSEGTGTNIGLNAKIDGLHRRLENVERISEYTRNGYENVERIVEYSRKGYENIERIVEYTRKQLEERSYHEHYHRLNEAIETVTASTPRMGFFLIVVIGAQVGLAATYIIYKRRRARMPKKYL